jgi:hypothetical protein
VDGQVNANPGSNGKVRARVVDCKPFQGIFRAGLAFESTFESGNSAPPTEEVPDYYELLQISPNADPDMIHRVYRLLAQRYHPDNGTTGDEKAFRTITDAYKVLSEPEKRAAYDVNLHAYRQTSLADFRPAPGVRRQGGGKIQAQRHSGSALHQAVRTSPKKPTMNLHELEDLLGCPREHLEFSLWYLKENGLVARLDNGRFAVTAKGVDWAEQEEAAERCCVQIDLLPASPHAEP